jgi:hypothetical protein
VSWASRRRGRDRFPLLAAGLQAIKRARRGLNPRLAMWIRLSLRRPCRGFRIDRFTRGVRGTRVADRLDFEIGVELETGLISHHPPKQTQNQQLACVIQNFWNGRRLSQNRLAVRLSGTPVAAEKPCPHAPARSTAGRPLAPAHTRTKLPTPDRLCKPEQAGA